MAAITFACSLGATSTVAAPEQAEMTGISNFSKIEDASSFAGPLVGFGGATLPAAMPSLKAAGFTTVINLRMAGEEDADIEANRAAADQAGLHFVHLPLDTDSPDPAVMNTFLATLGSSEYQPVYIHCGSATRAGALWMIGRVLEDGWEIEAASAEVEVIAEKPSAAIAFATGYLASRSK